MSEIFVFLDISPPDFLKNYAQYVMDFTASLSRQHGWLLCLIPRSHSWWSPEIARAISSYCLALWEQWHTDGLLSARCQWNSIIHHTKAASFCKFISQIVGEPQAPWKMIRWERTASYTLLEPPAVLLLKSSNPARDQSLLGLLSEPLTSSFWERSNFSRPKSSVILTLNFTDIFSNSLADGEWPWWAVTQKKMIQFVQSLLNKVPEITDMLNFLK